MALNDEVTKASDEDKVKAGVLVRTLCLEFAARITLPCDFTGTTFEEEQAKAASVGLRLTRYPPWYMGDDDRAGAGLDRVTFEATNRHALILAFEAKHAALKKAAAS